MNVRTVLVAFVVLAVLMLGSAFAHGQVAALSCLVVAAVIAVLGLRRARRG